MRRWRTNDVIVGSMFNDFKVGMLVKHIFILFFVPVATAFSVAAEIEVTDAYARAPIPGQTTAAAFMVLKNTGVDDRVLIGARSADVGKIEMHSHQHREGRMSMQREAEIIIPANGEFVFKPGGFHLMLFRLSKKLVLGASFAMELCFQDGSNKTVVLPVKSLLDE